MAKRKTATPASISEFFTRSDAEASQAGVNRWNRLTLAQRAKIKLAGADLSGCDLRGINLKCSKSFAGISFAGAVLTEARFTGTFNKASFAGATLKGAKLGGDFFEANFTKACLVGADLSSSHLRGAMFTDADLTRANLAGCSFLDCDLTGATLAEATFSGGWFNKKTKWPAGFVPPGDMGWLGQGTDPRLSGKGKKAVATGITGLMARLHKVIDPARMKRTLDMLKQEKHQLFFEIEPTLIRGIVRSQKHADQYYSCVLTEDGTYSCATPDIAKCMGLSNEPCKHILVLVIGLARAGLFDSAIADRWLVAAKTKNPRWNKTVQNHISDSLLKYKGVQAGEIDWRPTETIPEDFYAM